MGALQTGTNSRRLSCHYCSRQSISQGRLIETVSAIGYANESKMATRQPTEHIIRQRLHDIAAIKLQSKEHNTCPQADPQVKLKMEVSNGSS